MNSAASALAREEADFIAEALAAIGDEAKLHAIRDKVFAFNRAFPMPW